MTSTTIQSEMKPATPITIIPQITSSVRDSVRPSMMTAPRPCGTPVISCPRGALPEIVRPGVDGFLVQSIEEGCAAVERVAALDRAACRRRAEECFSPRAVVARYLDLYERVRIRLGTAR